MVDRLITDNLTARMPQGLARWNNADIEAVAKIACQVRAYMDEGGTPVDETFPPNLLTAYTGAPIDNYDNSFINFVQLKAKVKAVFNDTWVRNGTDKFQASLSLFGGVDYQTQFNENRVASSDFLIGLDRLAPDICSQAATAKTGPFTGFDLAHAVVDLGAPVTTSIEAETATATRDDGAALPGTVTATEVRCYSNCLISKGVTIASPGSYTFTVRANGQYGTIAPKLRLTIGAVSAEVQATTKNAYADYTATIAVTATGMVPVSVTFTNDYGEAASDTVDRNVNIDKFTISGPTGGGGTANGTFAKAQLNKMYQRMFYRDATAAEQTSALSLLTDIASISNLADAWTGVCEALVRHPDFLFTVPPSVDSLTGAARTKLLVEKLALDLVGRPPTAAEFASLDTGTTFAQMVDTYLASPDFKTYYFGRIRLRTESAGTALTDEPARLWTHLAITGKPVFELLTAEYLVDEQWNEVSRPPEHGKSGILTMKGYINNKQGLPHYNYAARVMTGFMGVLFDVPPEVFAMRATSTASSTVDPRSICFNCHQFLTPLSTQRLGWDDDGTYRSVDASGAPIDDSDRGLVDTYPYKGKGMEAFGTKAVKKEPFIRTMLQSQWMLMMGGRELRFDQDERGLYKELWDVTFAHNGDLREIIKTIALSKPYQRTL